MNFNNLFLSATCIALVGCQVNNEPPITPHVNLIAPTKISINQQNKSTVTVTAQLNNPTAKPLQLSAGTPCAIFRWSITSADQPIQKKPNQLCAQVVATEIAKPNSTIQQQYKITLHKEKYQPNKKYVLHYRFWNYYGVHEFVVED